MQRTLCDENWRRSLSAGSGLPIHAMATRRITTGCSGRSLWDALAECFSRLRERYGNPANVMDAQEERAQNRRFQWNTSTESLTLNCFRMPRQPLCAERLTITSSR